LKLECVYSSVVNLLADVDKGFDSFSSNNNTFTFALCDGANSCAGSGDAARWLSSFMVDQTNQAAIFNFKELSKFFFNAHHEVKRIFPETGSTLVYLSALPDKLILASVGDSYLQVFQPKSWKFGRWDLSLDMPRDLDNLGNPTQLVGSDVCHTLNISEINADGIYGVLMMSDGPGLLLDEEYIIKRLNTIGRLKPSKDDLHYLCLSMAQEALSRGCLDDTSVAVIWLKYTK